MSPGRETLLVLIDPRDEQALALRRAIASSRLAGADAMVHVVLACNANRPGSGNTKDFMRDQSWMDREVSGPLKEAGVAYECSFVWHGCWPEIALERAEQLGAKMIFMPSHEERPSPNPVLHRGRWSFLGYSPCPLMLVRGESTGEKRNTVGVAVNFQARLSEQIELNKRILACGVREAERNGADLHVINAYLDSMHYPDRGRLVRGTGLPASRVHVWPGYTDKVVAEAVREFEIDMLVMGAINQRGGQGSVRRGNTTARVLAGLHPDVDVLVVG